jgi:NADH-quinone oxidoreductase subunit K
MNSLFLFQLASLVMLGCGLLGLTTRRDLIGMLISVELLLNGAGLSVVAAAQLTNADASLGQLAALLIMGLAAAEATLVLAIVLVVGKRFKTTDADKISELGG